MASYLSSNEPYGRVDDGIGAGLIAGSVAGLAGYKGLGVGLNMMGAKSLGGGDLERGMGMFIQNQERFRRHFERETGNHKPNMNRAGRSRFEDYNTRQLVGAMDDGISKTILDKGYGTGRRRAITAGASVLAGGLVGGAIDGMN